MKPAPDATPNGTDANGNPIGGFKWWNFAYPTLVSSGANAIPDYVAATNGGVNFGGTAGAVTAPVRQRSPIKSIGQTAS